MDGDPGGFPSLWVEVERPSGLGCGGEKGSKCVDWMLVVALATGNWRGWQVNKPLNEEWSTTFGRFREPGGIESGH